MGDLERYILMDAHLTVDSKLQPWIVAFIEDRSQQKTRRRQGVARSTSKVKGPLASGCSLASGRSAGSL